MITNREFSQKLLDLLERPGMYNIRNIDDIQLIFFSEIFMNKNSELDKLSQTFSEFVRVELNGLLQDFHWARIIRLYSGSEYHSIELFKKMYSDFFAEQKL